MKLFKKVAIMFGQHNGNLIKRLYSFKQATNACRVGAFMQRLG